MRKRDMKYRVIYQIKNNINNKIYVGSAENYWNRMWVHISKLRKGKHNNTHLQQSFIKYGEKSFSFSILEMIGNSENIIEREQFWIDKLIAFDKKYGYNVVRYASSTLGFKFSAESKLKMSLAKINIPLSEEHKKNLKIAKINNHPQTGKTGKLSKLSKAIQQYDLDNNFIDDWESISQAALKLKVHKPNIILCLKGKIKQTGGFIFKYKEIKNHDRSTK